MRNRDRFAELRILVRRIAAFQWLFVILIFIVSGCAPERKETPTKGSAVILVSESIAPTVEHEQQKFGELYPETKLSLRTLPAREAVVQFFNVDSLKTLVSSRPLNDEERAVAGKFHLQFHEYKIAIDAIAVIANLKNSVKQLRTTQIDSIVRGKITRWNALGWKNSFSSVALCLPDQNMGEFEILSMKILQGKKFEAPATTIHTSLEMLEYVSSHSDALGFVSLSWLRDFTDKVNVLEISDPNVPDSLGIKGEYFSPHQAHVYRGYYPLTSDVYIYSRTDIYSVGSGFISFVTSGPGQQIILNNGLVPATQPVHLVELTNRKLR